MLPYNIETYIFYLNLVILTLLPRQQKVDQYSLNHKVKVIQLVRIIYSQCEKLIKIHISYKIMFIIDLSLVGNFESCKDLAHSFQIKNTNLNPGNRITMSLAIRSRK